MFPLHVFWGITRVIRCGGKSLYLLKHLTSPGLLFYLANLLSKPLPTQLYLSALLLGIPDLSTQFHLDYSLISTPLQMPFRNPYATGQGRAQEYSFLTLGSLRRSTYRITGSSDPVSYTWASCISILTPFSPGQQTLLTPTQYPSLSLQQAAVTLVPASPISSCLSNAVTLHCPDVSKHVLIHLCTCATVIRTN